MRAGLEKSIKSLISQDQNKYIEFIVVDGLSTDGSQDVIKQYKDHIDVIKIEKDTGIFHAMNKGVDLATGQYIYFLNSGDVFACANVLKYVLQEISILDSDCKIIYGNVAGFYKGFSFGIVDVYPWIVHQGAFVLGSLLKKYRFDENLKIFGDLDLWMRLKKDGNFSIYKVNKVITNMELDGVGSSPITAHERIKDKWTLAKKHKEYFLFIATLFFSLMEIFVYKFFGNNFYHKIYIKKMKMIKNFIKKIRNYSGLKKNIKKN
jgi:glycosyltransferase involved in cell wall biosynthesis